jgi:hypothetical protein
MSLRLLRLLVRTFGRLVAFLMLMFLDETEAICAEIWGEQRTAGRSLLLRFRSGLASRLSGWRSRGPAATLPFLG